MTDFSQLIPRLPAETLAMFEELSGLMFVNIPLEKMGAGGRLSDAGAASGDAGTIITNDENMSKIFAAINHETYHYFQVIATGYQFRYASDVWRTLLRGLVVIQLPWLIRDRVLRTRDRWSSRIFSRSYRERWIGLMALWRMQDRLLRARASAKPRDYSILGPQMPKLYARLDAPEARRRARNATGLSALDLIEASAVVYQFALTFAGEDWRGRLEAEWPNYNDTYRRAFEFARAVCGGRAYDVILPAVALALRYARPADAYLPFVTRLAAAPPGEEAAAARALADKPRTIPGAGRYLGTAWDVRRRQWAFPRLLFPALRSYDKVLIPLRDRARGVDAFDLLVDPGAAGKLSEIGFGFVFQDGPISADDNEAALIARLQMASIRLHSASLPRATREFHRWLETFPFLL
jgi:hypothetical protein